jgi:hypothetical protein
VPKVRTRIVLLALLLLVALSAGAACLWEGQRPAAPVEELTALILLTTGALALLRHAGLAVLVVAAPVPGFLAALAAMATLRPVAALPLTAAALTGYLLAAVLASQVAAQLAQGGAREESLPSSIRPLLGALVAALAAIGLAKGAHSATLAVALTAAASGLSAIATVVLGASLLPFGEDFAARTNRARETRQRWLSRLEPLAQTRWGWSLGGVAIVLAAVGYFGASPAWRGMTAALWMAPSLALVGVSFFLLGDWRRAASALLAAIALGLVSLWMAGASPGPALSAALGLGAAAIFLISARAAAFSRQGDDAATASLRALKYHGAAIVFALVTVALALLALAPSEHGASACCLSAIFAVLAALLFAPAFAIVIEDMFPRRATIEARYRVQ